MKYLVQMTALAVVWRTEEVEARSEEEAKKQALKQFGTDECGWAVNRLYDDGRLESQPEVMGIRTVDE